jgi:hypothetical protein
MPVTLRAGRLNTRIHHHFADVLGLATGECLMNQPPSVREHYPTLRTTPSIATALVLYHGHGTAPPVSCSSVLPGTAIGRSTQVG